MIFTSQGRSWAVGLLAVAACGGFGPAAPRAASVPIRAPGTVTQERFNAPDGAVYPYLVFTPSAWRPDRQLPVLLLIHGGGGRGVDMLRLWQSFADAQGILLVAPTFPLGAAFEAQVPQLFPALMDTVQRLVHFDRARAYVFGYSAGGYSTYDAATLTSTTFSGAGVFASIITPDYDWIVARAHRKIPIAIYLGDEDPFFTLAQGRRTRDVLVAAGFPVHYVEMAHQGHDYAAVSAFVNADAWAFMSTVPPRGAHLDAGYRAGAHGSS